MKIVGTVLAVIGIILIGSGGFIFVREQIFVHTAEQAVAVVTGNESVNYTGNVNEMGIQHYYCSVFQFQTMDGQTFPFKEGEGRLNQANCGYLDSAPDYKIGEEVPVYYDPRDPGNTVQIPKLVKKYYSYALTIAFVGLLLAAIGVFFLREDQQNKKREAASQQKKMPVNYSPNPNWDKLLEAEKEITKRKKKSKSKE